MIYDTVYDMMRLRCWLSEENEDTTGKAKHMWLRFKCNHWFARVCARYFHFYFDAWGMMDLLCNKNEPFDFTLLNKQRLSKVFHPSWSVSPANAPRVAFARSSSFRHPTQSTRLNFSRSQWVAGLAGIFMTVGTSIDQQYANNWQVSWAHANEPWLRAWAESADKRNRTAGHILIILRPGFLKEHRLHCATVPLCHLSRSQVSLNWWRMDIHIIHWLAIAAQLARLPILSNKRCPTLLATGVRPAVRHPVNLGWRWKLAFFVPSFVEVLCV